MAPRTTPAPITEPDAVPPPSPSAEVPADAGASLPPALPQPDGAGRGRRHLTLLRGGPDERGITTAEYAVGTAAGAGLAGLLYTMLTGGLGEKLIGTLFDHALAMLGVG